MANLGAANLTAANNGAYDVQILQMWDEAGNTHQNQLVLHCVPDAGSSLALLAMGLVGMTAVRARTNRLAK